MSTIDKRLSALERRYRPKYQPPSVFIGLGPLPVIAWEKTSGGVVFRNPHEADTELQERTERELGQGQYWSLDCEDLCLL